jgi:hypothetical protein
MKKEKLDKLTEALEGAGFEVVSLKEETQRDLWANGTLNAFVTNGEHSGKLDDRTGFIALEVKTL